MFRTAKTLSVVFLSFVLGLAASRVSSPRSPAPTSAFTSPRATTVLLESEVPLPEMSIIGTDPGGTRRQADRALAVAEDVEEEYLRRRKRDREEVLSLEDWSDFYDVAEVLDLWPQQLERQIFDRLRSELQLSSEQMDALESVFCREKAEVSRQLTEHYGHILFDLFDLDREFRVRVLSELGPHRERIRRTFDASYLNVISAGQLEVVNRHLRSPRIAVNRNVTDRSVWIDGVGAVSSR